MFTENLDDFLDTSYGLATAATLQGGAAGGVAGFLDEAYLGDVGISGTNPVFVCKATAVLAADVRKTLTVAGTTFTIVNREPIDDGAFVRLQLQR